MEASNHVGDVLLLVSCGSSEKQMMPRASRPLHVSFVVDGSPY